MIGFAIRRFAIPLAAFVIGCSGGADIPEPASTDDSSAADTASGGDVSTGDSVGAGDTSSEDVAPTDTGAPPGDADIPETVDPGDATPDTASCGSYGAPCCTHYSCYGSIKLDYTGAKALVCRGSKCDQVDKGCGADSEFCCAGGKCQPGFSCVGIRCWRNPCGVPGDSCRASTDCCSTVCTAGACK